MSSEQQQPTDRNESSGRISLDRTLGPNERPTATATEQMTTTTPASSTAVTNTGPTPTTALPLRPVVLASPDPVQIHNSFGRNPALSSSTGSNGSNRTAGGGGGGEPTALTPTIHSPSNSTSNNSITTPANSSIASSSNTAAAIGGAHNNFDLHHGNHPHVTHILTSFPPPTTLDLGSATTTTAATTSPMHPNGSRRAGVERAERTGGPLTLRRRDTQPPVLQGLGFNSSQPGGEQQQQQQTQPSSSSSQVVGAPTTLAEGINLLHMTNSSPNPIVNPGGARSDSPIIGSPLTPARLGRSSNSMISSPSVHPVVVPNLLNMSGSTGGGTTATSSSTTTTAGGSVIGGNNILPDVNPSHHVTRNSSSSSLARSTASDGPPTFLVSAVPVHGAGPVSGNNGSNSGIRGAPVPPTPPGFRRPYGSTGAGSIRRSPPMSSKIAPAADSASSSRAMTPATPGSVSLDIFSQIGCGTITYLVSSHAFSIVCSYFGEPEDLCTLCLVNKRIKDASRYYCDHILINLLSTKRAPGIRHVRSVVINNVGLWHYGRENFQDGLILFIPPPGAAELDPSTHAGYGIYEGKVVSDHLSLRNTSELDYDSNGAQQKFRFSTAWLPTPRSAYNYFHQVRFLELMDFLNGLDWYLSFLDPVVIFGGGGGGGDFGPGGGGASEGWNMRTDTGRHPSPAPSIGSTMSAFSENFTNFNDSYSTNGGNSTWGALPPPGSPNAMGTSLLASSSTLLAPYSSSRSQGERLPTSSALVNLEEVRFVNCRVTTEDVKVCVQTQYAARRLVVVETGSAFDTFSCDTSPRGRRSRVFRTRQSNNTNNTSVSSSQAGGGGGGPQYPMTSVIPTVGNLFHLTSERYTQVVDLARTNTQQLEELLNVGSHLKRVIVRCLLVVDQSAMETACHSRLESLSLTCAPDSTVRETSLELYGDQFPRLRECLLVGCPVTALGPGSNSLELLHLGHCQIDIRDDLTFPNASVIMESCRLFSPLNMKCTKLATSNLSGMELKPSEPTECLGQEGDGFGWLLSDYLLQHQLFGGMPGTPAAGGTGSSPNSRRESATTSPTATPTTTQGDANNSGGEQQGRSSSGSASSSNQRQRRFEDADIDDD